MDSKPILLIFQIVFLKEFLSRSSLFFNVFIFIIKSSLSEVAIILK
jgi:hypothetical protein